MSRTTALLLTLLLLPLVATAQMSEDALRSYRLRQIEEIIKEKIHMPLKIDAAKDKGSDDMPQASNEKRISTSYPESEVDAAINPTDTANIVIGPMKLSTSLAMPIYYSTNFGQSWKQSSFAAAPYETGALVAGGGDPVFAFDADGKLYMTWIDLYFPSVTALDSLRSGMYWAYSTNKGATWQRPSNGVVASGFSVLNSARTQIDTTTGLDDKEWITVDRTNSPYHNTLYVAWTLVSANGGGVMLRRKLPGSDVMEAPVAVSSKNLLRVQYTSIGVDAHGGVHVTYMGSPDTMHYGIYHAYSADGGKTFQPEVKISDADIPGTSWDATDDLIFGVRPPGNYPCPHLSIDTANTGYLYMVWDGVGVTEDEHHGSDIYFSRSTNNGQTWSDAQVVNNDHNANQGVTTDHFYPTIAVNGKGDITVCWYDRREDPNNESGRYYMARSTDHGVTWVNTPVAASPMDFNFVTQVNGNFGIGEYTQVLASPNYTIPVWSDGRDNSGQLRVYAAFINSANAHVEQMSTVGEGVELAANHPNPFSATTTFEFTLSENSHAHLFVTNPAGQTVATLLDESEMAGTHDVPFDGSHLASGVYYLNLETSSGIVHRAITVMH